jgi:hypothetical protein
MEKIPPPFEQLIGDELSGVTFVRDYIQLQFDPPPIMNILTPMIIESSGSQIAQSDVAFPNAIISQIGKLVSDLEYDPENYLRIVFSDSSKITISLKQQDYVGPEAIIFF